MYRIARISAFVMLLAVVAPIVVVAAHAFEHHDAKGVPVLLSGENYRTSAEDEGCLICEHEFASFCLPLPYEPDTDSLAYREMNPALPAFMNKGFQGSSILLRAPPA